MKELETIEGCEEFLFKALDITESQKRMVRGAFGVVFELGRAKGIEESIERKNRNVKAISSE